MKQHSLAVPLRRAHRSSLQHTAVPKRLGFTALAVAVGLFAALVVATPVHADLILDLGRGSVLVQVPPDYNPDQPTPLVMLLHGYGASGPMQEGYLHIVPWADELGFVYVNPNGTRDPGGNRFWNATDACCDFYGSGVDDSTYLRDLIEAIMDELNIDPEKVFILGHSNGGFMAYRMACDHADLITAVASLAGATFSDPNVCTPSEPVHTLQIHGTADSTVLYDGGTTLLDVPAVYPGAVETTEMWAALNHCSETPNVHRSNLDLLPYIPGCETAVSMYAANCDEGGSSQLWTIEGGGHIPDFSMYFIPYVLDYFFSGGQGGALLMPQLTIPAVAYAEGAEGSFYETTLDVSNVGAIDLDYQIAWLPRGTDNDDPLLSETFTLAPGASTRYSNVLSDVFDLEPNAFGALRFDATSDDLRAVARIANTPQIPGSGSFGQAVTGLRPCDCISMAEQRRILFGTEDSEMRFNVGCFNADSETAVIMLRLNSSDGTELDTKILALPSWGNDQLNRIFEGYDPVNGTVDYWTGTPFGKVYCFGSMLDNVTSDPTTIPPM